MQTEIYCQMTNNTKCPFCGEEIQITAKKCKHCGEWLNNHCPICGETIPQNANICPECNTPLKQKNQKYYSTLFKILSVLSIFGCLFITVVFTLLCIGTDQKDVADFDFKVGITIFYTLFMFIPYFIPVSSLCIGIEKNFSSVTTVINTIVSVIFLFSLTFAGVVK